MFCLSFLTKCQRGRPTSLVPFQAIKRKATISTSTSFRPKKENDAVTNERISKGCLRQVNSPTLEPQPWCSSCLTKLKIFPLKICCHVNQPWKTHLRCESRVGKLVRVWNRPWLNSLRITEQRRTLPGITRSYVERALLSLFSLTFKTRKWSENTHPFPSPL